MNMQEILQRELNTLFESRGHPGLPPSLSLEVQLDLQKETFFLKQEQQIFEELIHMRDKTKTFYHYTSFPALMEILKSGKIRFSSPAGLNDITEISSGNTILKEQLDPELDEIRLHNITKRFIFSLTDRYDNLNQWRLYGADGTGVCLGLDLSGISDDKYLRFGCILYGEAIAATLSRIRSRITDELQKNFDFRDYQRWGYFIKDSDYAEESEYRLICYDDSEKLLNKASWRINNHGAFYPYLDMDMKALNMELETILFGPKFKEKVLNKGMIENYLTRYYSEKQISIEFSSIKSYR
ncbi:MULTISPECIES: DUF2971 domain-containing protein [unclassified Oceanispirochaeta]|uniref:DUF2971 domain-containing protein n=1 Tax=unclassified Oceanispirochaeta TaxID=2635722 RepID=UPI001313D8E3|nr:MULTISPECIES: DUF2971 domain-containing protein [unclassified Oceanispirochaeta]MBF9014520.1 DUF2971 domain-containing protein [Oceanispirochaeta sp. M2]NPD70776.1 DUF2971 domain-containing protein [Oceanispirochaeta sp. M1]